MPPPLGEQRCHSSYSSGQQPAMPQIQDWSAVSRPGTACSVSHHGPASRSPVAGRPSLMAYVDAMLAHVPVLRLKADSLDEEFVEVDESIRSQFQVIATPWELQHSRLLTLSGYVPIVDEVNTVLAYARSYKSTGVYFFVIYSLDGDTLWNTTTGEDPLESDFWGNELLATIVTLGGALIVKSLARGIMAAMASQGEGLLTKVALTAARGLSAEGQRAVLLALRSLRARAIVRALSRRGAKVIVNIGGEGGPEELAQFGEQIALNDAVRMTAAKRLVPNLVKEPGENIGRVFKAESVDTIVSRRLDKGFDVDQVAKGSFKVLKSGGEVKMQIFGNDVAFGKRFLQALTDSGFKDPKVVNNVEFLATKP